MRKIRLIDDINNYKFGNLWWNEYIDYQTDSDLSYLTIEGFCETYKKEKGNSIVENVNKALEPYFYCRGYSVICTYDGHNMKSGWYEHNDKVYHDSDKYALRINPI